MAEAVKEKIKDPYAEVLEVGRELMARVDTVCHKTIIWGRDIKMEERAGIFVSTIRAQQATIMSAFLGFMGGNPEGNLPELFASCFSNTFHQGVLGMRHSLAYGKLIINESRELGFLLKKLEVVAKGNTRSLTFESSWTRVADDQIQMSSEGEYCKVVVTKYEKAKGSRKSRKNKTLEESYKRPYYVVEISLIGLDEVVPYLWAVGSSFLESSKGTEETEETGGE